MHGFAQRAIQAIVRIRTFSLSQALSKAGLGAFEPKRGQIGVTKFSSAWAGARAGMGTSARAFKFRKLAGQKSSGRVCSSFSNRIKGELSFSRPRHPAVRPPVAFVGNSDPPTLGIVKVDTIP